MLNYPTPNDLNWTTYVEFQFYKIPGTTKYFLVQIHYFWDLNLLFLAPKIKVMHFGTQIKRSRYYNFIKRI